MTSGGNTIEDILDGDDSAYVRVVTVKLPRARQELWDEHERLDALLPTLVSDTIDAHPEKEATARRLAEIETELEESGVSIKLRAVGHRAWADLLREHPPTRAQLSQDRAMDHNPETFPEAAIAASSAEPVMTVEQVVALTAKPWFNEKCWQLLWDACLRVNVAEAVPKSLAAGLILRRSGGFAPTAASEESPAQSS